MPMILIQSQTLSGSADFVMFSNIPQTYKTLRLVVSARGTNAGAGLSIRMDINGGGTSTTQRYLMGNGATASSNDGDAYIPGSGATANTFGSFDITFPNYTGSAQKTYSMDCVTENNSSTAYQYIAAGKWANTSAISSLLLYGSGYSLVAGSSFTLYGLS